MNIAIIGLDTSHSVEFPRRMQDPECKPELRVAGMQAVSCLRFPTPFTNDQVLDDRQAQLERWGVKVTTDFDEAVADCDAIMLEINDPTCHVDYFRRCVDLGKPIFIDKPLADTYAQGQVILDLAARHQAQVISASPLRFSHNMEDACQIIRQPAQAYCYGPLGIPPAGDGIIWYGVHCFEMLQRMMGSGAQKIDARRDGSGVVAIVTYADGRRGIAELTVGKYAYGGTLRSDEQIVSFVIDGGLFYTEELRVIKDFFLSGQASFSLADSLEVLDLIDSAVRSVNQGCPVLLNSASSSAKST